MRWQTTELLATIPMRLVGPLLFKGPEVSGEVTVPLATFESPLWPSTHRGSRVCAEAGGILAMVLDERMTRSILLEAPTVIQAQEAVINLKQHQQAMQTIISETSSYARLIDVHTQVVGNLLFVRLEFSTGDAAGHNMVTIAADRLMEWILLRFDYLKYVSISANYCSDKKATAVNGILGRGKYVVAEVIIPAAFCKKYLKTTPEKINNINIRKNLLGNIVAGGLLTANAHFANMLLGFYLATGQDAANIIEGSQGWVYTEVRDNGLYFSVTLPNLIVGTIGSGKTYDFVRENLKLLGCLEEREVGANARRLAIIAAGTVLCGELSLLAAQTNQGELVRAHMKLERGDRKRGE